MLNAEDIDKRLTELDLMINRAINERNQLIGYKQCLIENNEGIKNGKIPTSNKEVGPKVRSKTDTIQKGQDT